MSGATGTTTTTARESRGTVVRPTLCGLLILVSALPFAVVGPRLKAEYDHMRRSEAPVAPVAVPVSPVASHTAADGTKVIDGRRKEQSR